MSRQRHDRRGSRHRVGLRCANPTYQFQAIRAVHVGRNKRSALRRIEADAIETGRHVKTPRTLKNKEVNLPHSSITDIRGVCCTCPVSQIHAFASAQPDSITVPRKGRHQNHQGAPVHPGCSCLSADPQPGGTGQPGTTPSAQRRASTARSTPPTWFACHASSAN